jgi:formate dehydrogenase subunit gamma
MFRSLSSSIRTPAGPRAWWPLLLALLLCLGLSASVQAEPAAQATAAQTRGTPPVVPFIAQAQAQTPGAAPGTPTDTNAQRAKTQPGNNAPFWREVRHSGEQAGITTVRGPETGVLEQRFTQYPGSSLTTAGEAWRQVRNGFVIPYGGSLLIIVLVAIGLYNWRRGTMGRSAADTGGATIERFTPFERAAHWLNALAFVILALSGIVMAFGKFFLLPVMGSTLFGWLSYALKTLHNFVGPLFIVTLVIVILTFVKDNLPQRGDWLWLKHGGGLFGGEVPASHRFNTGEKGMFWVGFTLAGLVVVFSGLWLDQLVPVWGASRGDMQTANLIHATAAVIMMLVLMGHIYMGTLGLKGAAQGMRTGRVGMAWAQEHHALWAQDIADGRIPAQRSAGAKGAPSAPANPQPKEASS